jgi:hypothetical protein
MAGVILIAMDRQFAAHLLGIFLLLISCGVDTLYKVPIILNLKNNKFKKLFCI